jgi:hypothetical protein
MSPFLVSMPTQLRNIGVGAIGTTVLLDGPQGELHAIV